MRACNNVLRWPLLDMQCANLQMHATVRLQLAVPAHHTWCCVQVPHASRGELLGFFWTSSLHAQFVLVTSDGLQCYELADDGLVATKASKELQGVANADKAEILWYKYQHHSRILLLGTPFDLVVLQITNQVGMLFYRGTS